MEQTQLVSRCCVCVLRLVPNRHWAVKHSQLSVLPGPDIWHLYKHLDKSSCTMRDAWRAAFVAVRLQPPLLRCQAALSARLCPATQCQ